jgi:hypothetical protein
MKKSLMLLPVFFAALIITVAIIRSHAVPIGIGAQPEIVSFEATPTVAEPGQPVILAWKVRGPASMDLESATEGHSDATRPERTKLPGTGRVIVYPKHNTVYSLICETADGPMCSTSLTVRTK